MQGVTTAIVAFIFACIIWPHLIKHRSQFYGAVALLLAIILFDCIAHMSGGPDATATDLHPVGLSALQRFCYVVVALLQIAAIVVLIMSTGGQTLSEIAGEMHKTIDVVRRGGEAETLVVPIKGEQPRPRERVTAIPPAPARPPEDTSIPMDT